MIRPLVGFSRPARHRKSVVLPAPDGPKRMVIDGPGGIRRLASTRNPVSNRFSMSAINSKEPYLPIKCVYDGKNNERNDQQSSRSDRRLGIIQSLHLIIDIDRQRSSDSGNISTDHKDHAELSQSMGKAQNSAGQHTCPRQRNDHPKKSFYIGNTEHPGSLNVLSLNASECCRDRLNREGQAVENRSEYQTTEREWKTVADNSLIPPPKKT